MYGKSNIPTLAYWLDSGPTNWLVLKMSGRFSKWSILSRQRLPKERIQAWDSAMRTHRFGRKIKLPSTIVIKHQLRKLMFEDLVKEGEDAALQCSDVSGFEGKPEVAGTDSSRRA